MNIFSRQFRKDEEAGLVFMSGESVRWLKSYQAALRRKATVILVKSGMAETDDPEFEFTWGDGGPTISELDQALEHVSKKDFPDNEIIRIAGLRLFGTEPGAVGGVVVVVTMWFGVLTALAAMWAIGEDPYASALDKTWLVVTAVSASLLTLFARAWRKNVDLNTWVLHRIAEQAMMEDSDLKTELAGVLETFRKQRVSGAKD